MSDESAKMKEGNISLSFTLSCKSSICEEQKMEGGNSIRLDSKRPTLPDCTLLGR